MGLRDKIAFLMCTSKSLGDYSDAIDDVLSILDEHLGELVDEIPAEEFAFYRTIPEGAGPDKMLKWIEELLVTSPGDRVSIYVRK